MIANTDGDDPRLAELLLRWEELHDEGRSISADELCLPCPELAQELGRRIALLRQLDPVLADATATAGDSARPAAAGDSSRQSASARADFRDLRFHAAGGLGEVFMARNAELNREVALKFLKAERSHDPESLRRFLQEAEVTGRLEHPGVVPIYALGIDGSGAPCYAMRFIRGETLQDSIDAFHVADKPGRDPSERSLALRELLSRFVSICSTMAYAHSRGILHRDLKPRNVMLGKFDETLVVDWGLAKPFDRDEAARAVGEETLMPRSGSEGNGSDTPTVGVVGTPAYMSPEQAEAQWDIVGPASDIFGLAAILYAILTGRPPYQGRSIREVLEKVKRCEYPAPRQVRPRVSRALEAVCLKAMAKKPEDRYATALDLAADVRRWLADEPVTAYAEPVTVRARRWVRRHRSLVTSTAVVLVFGLAVLAAFATILAGKNRELDAKNVALANKNRELDANNVELDNKNQELDRQRQRVEERENLAIEAVRKFRDAVQDNPMLKNDVKLDALRKAILKEPLEFFRRLRDQLQADRDTRPEALAKLADANYALAYTTAEIGSIPDAIRSYSEALAIRERLASNHPAVAHYQRDLVASHYSMGTMLAAAGRPIEALESLRRALSVQERLVRENPTVTEDLRFLSTCHNSIGSGLNLSGRPTEALDSYRRALAILERLARDNPTDTQYQSDLAANYDSFGNGLWYSQDYRGAAEWYRRAIAILSKLLTVDPKNLRDRDRMVVSQTNLGNAKWASGDLAGAAVSYRLAIAIGTELVGAAPDISNSRFMLGRALNNLGTLLQAQERFHEAEQAFRQAIEHQRISFDRTPQVIDNRRFLRESYSRLSQCLRALSRGDEAAQIARTRRALCANDPVELYVGARELASRVPTIQGTEQGQALAAEAVQDLKEAIAAGWDNALYTSRDPGLAPLSDRDDFRRLLAELFDRGFPADPFAR